jgi:two-component SAPR family response regulator
MSANRPKILIVEDEYLIVFMLQMCYEQMGFDVVETFDCADKAIHFVEKNPNIDLISMDISLASTKTGLDAARIIRNSGNNTPILFISGNTDFQKEVNKISFSSFSEKPIGLDGITHAVNRILGLSLK